MERGEGVEEGRKEVGGGEEAKREETMGLRPNGEGLWQREGKPSEGLEYKIFWEGPHRDVGKMN